MIKEWWRKRLALDAHFANNPRTEVEPNPNAYRSDSYGTHLQQHR